MQRWSVPLLRISLGIVFIWFGALEVFALTAVTDLVAVTVYWVDPDWFVPALGVIELTVEGEFVIENLVLLTAGLVVGSTIGSEEETIRRVGRPSSDKTGAS